MNSSNHEVEIHRAQRRFIPRFGLRLIFIVTGLVAIVLGVGLPWNSRAKKQANAIRTIELNGGCVAYDFQYSENYPHLIPKPGRDPNIFCRWFGSEYFRRPVFVVLSHQVDEFLAIKFPPPRWIDQESESVVALQALGAGVEHLDIRFTKLKDLNFLQSLPNLKILDVRKQGIFNIDPLEYLPKIERLYLSQNPIADYSVLECLAKLQVLDMRGHHLQHLNVLNESNQLTEAFVSGTNLKDISALANKRNLKSLDISRSKVSDLSALKGLNLRQLNINMTGVDSIASLESSSDLESLDANATKISDLNPLGNKTKLKRLFVGNTDVSDLRPLANLKLLQDVGFTQTKVVDGSVLLELPNLRRCFVTPIVASELGDRIPLARN